MRKIKFITVKFIILTILIGCSKDSEIEKIEPAEFHFSYSSFYTPQYIGQVHNEALGYLVENSNGFPFESFNKARQETQEVLCSFVENELNLTNGDLQIAKDAIHNALDWGANQFNDDNWSLEDISEINQIVNQVYEQNIIGIEEKNYIDDVLSLFTDITSPITPLQRNSLKSQISIIENSWTNQNYDLSIGEGYLSGIVIFLAKYSLDFWDEYYGSDDFHPALWKWDVAVGIVAAGGSFLDDVLVGDPLDWRNAGAKGLYWGTTGSGLRYIGRNFF